MPNEHDYDEAVMSEAVPIITVPFLHTPTYLATFRSSQQDNLLNDL
jgi:hypothetical protein